MTSPAFTAPRRAMLLGLLASVTGVGLVWRASRRQPALAEAPPGPVPALRAATLVNDERPVPAFSVRTAQGELTERSLLGHWTLLFFGYTQCPDVCPGTLGMLSEALRGLGDQPPPQVLFISVDPARDTPALLAQYVPSFDPRFVGAAGSDTGLAELVRHLGVRYERHAPGAAGQYTVDHTASVFLLDPQARLKAVFSPPHEAPAVAAALAGLIG